MYRVDRNNFYRTQKNATVHTPPGVSQFIFNLVGSKIDKGKPVLDPCVGAGSLLRPFKKSGFATIGIDVEKQGFPGTMVANYLSIGKGKIKAPSLVIMNPPFNIDAKTKSYVKSHYGGRPLLPEVWLQKAIELFGVDTPIVLFTPYGLRLNQCEDSKRWQKFVTGIYPEITSIISLPKNVFSGILFHSEILLFNISGLNGHYFYRNEKTNSQQNLTAKSARSTHV